MNKNLVLIGMPGSGKTTLGDLLSKELKLKLYDVDNFIEKTENKSIPEIFELGEEHFRTIETKAIEEISLQTGVIISTGGGVVKSPYNMKALRKNGLIFFINRPIENIISDIATDSRPLLKDGTKKVYTLYNERYKLYKTYCDYEILNDKNINDSVSKIKDILLERSDFL
ncbi:shikimate kinase [Clostridium acidisoli DSM 12555]|uniref:Shikimate kinase n=1 Tax=Clostridium acidisoli DSM 12555 TaxID=1121291 RepID=A0A1W1XUH5_9CLOT|nr:shikimate kinase [Clostridium acidisoli]SMC27556.1 shikimate kinase [Clostridium acidisoli DSM 12555]